MPAEEVVSTVPQLNSAARAAHLHRTKDRIAWWRERLQQQPTEALRVIALEELTHYERQLHQPLTKRTLRHTPVPGPSPLERMIAALQTEVAELKARVRDRVAPSESTPTAHVDAS